MTSVGESICIRLSILPGANFCEQNYLNFYIILVNLSLF